jgi:hypothetical protein
MKKMNGRAGVLRSGWVLLAAAGMLLLAGAGWSEPGDGSPAFLQELQRLLTREGWSAGRIGELAGQPVEWQGLQARDAELVALALRYAASQDGGIGPVEQARIAVQVALMAQQMRSLGYGEPQMLRAALNGVREALQLQARTANGQQSQAASGSGATQGDTLRTRLQEQLQQQLRLASCDQAQEQLQARVQEQKRTHTGEMVSTGPLGGGSSGEGGGRR